MKSYVERNSCKVLVGILQCLTKSRSLLCIGVKWFWEFLTCSIHSALLGLRLGLLCRLRWRKKNLTDAFLTKHHSWNSHRQGSSQTNFYGDPIQLMDRVLSFGNGVGFKKAMVLRTQLHSWKLKQNRTKCEISAKKTWRYSPKSTSFSWWFPITHGAFRPLRTCTP